MTFAILMCISQNGFSENGFLKAVPDVVDLGAIEEGSPAAVAVMIQNTGTTPVDITNVRTN
jgi:hypothetical protein